VKEGWISELGVLDDYDESDNYRTRLKTHVLYSEDKWYLIYRPAAQHSPKYGVLHPCGKGASKPREMIRIDSTTGAGTLECPFCKQHPSDEFFLAWSLRDDDDQSGGGNAVADDTEFAKALAAELRKSRPIPRIKVK
jgi:hypothetical protein